TASAFTKLLPTATDAGSPVSNPAGFGAQTRAGSKISPRRHHGDTHRIMAEYPSAATPYLDRSSRRKRAVHRGNRAGIVSLVAFANGQHDYSSFQWRYRANRCAEWRRNGTDRSCEITGSGRNVDASQAAAGTACSVRASAIGWNSGQAFTAREANTSGSRAI